ncbi:mannose-6-phosphate isomerase [Bacillus sp. HNG]|uniref:type I phosphomannose isomerase catalytic subunit n=1 Tax=Bacillus sp. HNG TaxID=2293325 RepID=UPI000E2FB9AE|nr:type I phosphomannose isomerase catalytic subunit [Bacillus sp. HNG]RFB18544.1 mannose-6-phosphate isomerase [Bacillus sp. HNG]
MNKSLPTLYGDFPLKLAPARAWRTYVGGKLIEELHGVADQDDNHFPEEWLMSIVSARNVGREHIVDEGLSKVDLPDIDVSLKSLINENAAEFLGESHFEKFGNNTGVLAKIIDSAERLTVQVHPNRDKAKELFNSAYGKTECWHIIGGREINGEPPYVYLGFKPGVTRELWESLFENQDIEGMLNCLHKYDVKPGDTFLIEGGTPHAIGSGCLLVEIQEPTDLTIRIEKVSPTGFEIDDFMCHQGIGFEKMFDCFNYDTYTQEETLEKWYVRPFVRTEVRDNREIELIGYQQTPYFKMTLVEVESEIDITNDGVFSGLYILSGSGSIGSEGYRQSFNIGDQFFIPAKVSGFTLRNEGDQPLKALRIFGPRITD